MTFLGGRKAAVTLLILGVGIGTVAIRGDVPPNFLQLLGWIFSAFVLGNVGASFAGALAQSKAAAPAPQIDLEPIKASLELQQQALGYLVTTTQKAEQMIEAQRQQQQSGVAGQAARNRAAIQRQAPPPQSGFNPDEG